MPSVLDVPDSFDVNLNNGLFSPSPLSFPGVAMIVAIIVRRTCLPYTAGLILTGQGLVVAGFEMSSMLSPDFILIGTAIIWRAYIFVGIRRENS